MPNIKHGKFVILGGASQVGTHIAQQLLAMGVSELTLLDNLSLGAKETMAASLSDERCRFLHGDVLNIEDLTTAMEGADGVFAVAGIMASTMRHDPAMGLGVNVQGIHNALEACRQQDVSKLILSSSVGVYGFTDGTPINEASPLHWHNTSPELTLYCASKIVGEGLARLYKATYGLDYVALRYSGVYGEHQHRRALRGGYIAETCARLRRGEPAIIDGEGTQVQDYIHAADVARANILAMESAVTGEAFNICGGEDVSQADLIKVILRACGSSQLPQFRAAPVSNLPVSKVQAYRREKAKNLLGWEPEISLEEGVRRVLAWVDSGHG